MYVKPAALQFTIANFASLPTEVGSRVYTERQTDCNGNKWKLRLAPGGEEGNAKAGCIGLYLWSCNAEPIEVKHSLSIIDEDGSCVEERSSNVQTLPPWNGKGWRQFIEHSCILDPANNLLKDGALRINATIQMRQKEGALYLSPGSHSENMLNLLKSEEGADVSFTVRGKPFLAHSIIIKANAPILTNYCNRITGEHEGSTPETIEDISAEEFMLVLEYVYSGSHPSNEDAIKHGKELIDAANKYDLVGLKMAVENSLVQECVITMENVSEYIIFADSKCCPLLKEHAVSFFLLRAQDILKSEHSKQLRESGELLSEMWSLMVNENQGSSMSVDQLRKELGKRKLDVDGSKKALVARLEQAKKQERD